MTKIKDMLITRRREIMDEIGLLHAELEQIDAALDAIEPPGKRRKTPTKSRMKGRQKAMAKGRQERAPSIAAQSVSILEQNPAGLSTTDIAEKLRERLGRQTTARTVSTQLSSLKRKGRVTQEGRRWKLPAAQAIGADGDDVRARQAEQ